MDLIIQTIQDDMVTLILLIGSLGVLMLLNIVLGAVMAAAGSTFSVRTFFNGVLKAILVALVMIVFCGVLEVLPFVLNRVGISLPSELVTYIEVIGTIMVAVAKYIKGIYSKLQTLLDVKEEEVKEYFDDGNYRYDNSAEVGEG